MLCSIGYIIMALHISKQFDLWLTKADTCIQWRNRRGGGGGGAGGAECPPQRLLTEKFLLTYREKVARKKLKRGKKKRKMGNGRRKKEGKVENERRGLFFLLFTFQNTDPYMTFDPSNVLHFCWGFFLLNLVAIGYC